MRSVQISNKKLFYIFSQQSLVYITYMIIN